MFENVKSPNSSFTANAAEVGPHALADSGVATLHELSLATCVVV